MGKRDLSQLKKLNQTQGTTLAKNNLEEVVGKELTTEIQQEPEKSKTAEQAEKDEQQPPVVRQPESTATSKATMEVQPAAQTTERVDNASTSTAQNPEKETEEDSDQLTTLPVKKASSTSVDLPGKLKRILMADNETSMRKTNLSINEDVVNELNSLKPFMKKKNLKTTANGLASAIIKDWLVRNGEDLERIFGYKPNL